MVTCVYTNSSNSEVVNTGHPHVKMTFWNAQKKGANMFNMHIDPEDIRAAKRYGIQFLRIAFDKFPSVNRDFLIGNADEYSGLAPQDLEQVKKVLAICTQEQMPVVITVLSLPGSRWRQHNDFNDDLRLWMDATYQQEAVLFWQDFAREFNEYSIIVGYNILNEPHPEKMYDKDCVYNDHNLVIVHKILSNFYNAVISGIRSYDKNTPIIVDSFCYADPQSFAYLTPYTDPAVLYSFHMYEPYCYTNFASNKGKWKYPGVINGSYWDKEALALYMNAVHDFQKSYNIPSERIIVGEFGCNRKTSGIEYYFTDLIALFNQYGWHWAFYAFREEWDGMDYERGTNPVPSMDRNSNQLPFSILSDAF